jgi:hypothetical protein
MRSSSQSSVRISLIVISQIKTTPRASKSTTEMVEISSSFFMMLQTNQYFLIALGCMLLVVTCCLCIFYRKWRQKRVSKTSKFTNPTIKSASSKSYTTNQTASSFNFTTAPSSSTYDTSSAHSSEYSQNQTMSITLASNELGIFNHFSLMESLIFINLFDIRPLSSCLYAC